MNRIKLIPPRDIAFILMLSSIGGSLACVLFHEWRLGFVVAGIMALVLIAVVVLFNYGARNAQPKGRRTDRQDRP